MKQAPLVGALALALSAAPAFSQSRPPAPQRAGQTPKTGTSTSPVSDHQFAIDAAHGGLAEVELGHLAEQKAASDRVKQFGRKMVEDHGKANDELTQVAKQQPITLPTTLDSKDEALKDRLSKLSGDSFDRAYINAMVRDHKKDVNEFRKEAEHGRNPDIKAFAASTLPTLEQHLRLAENIQASVVGTSGTKGGKQIGSSGRK